jgi:hypothetical protein
VSNFYFISPISHKSDYLYDTLVPTFISEGHSIVDDIEKADFVFYDLWVGCGEYDRGVIAKAIVMRLPVYVFDFFDFNDRVTWQGFSNFENVKHEWWAYNLLLFLKTGLVKTYFMRKMNKTLKYPDYVKPIEHIIEYYFGEVSESDLFNREFDICFIGNTSPERRSVVSELQKYFKCDIHWTNENGKLSHEDWIKRHYSSKMFLEADGGGYGSERPFKLMSTAIMLRQKNNMFRLNDWGDGDSSIDIKEVPTRFDIEDLQLLLSEPETLYSIYKKGNENLKTYFTAEARAKYVLNSIQ